MESLEVPLESVCRTSVFLLLLFVLFCFFVIASHEWATKWHIQNTVQFSSVQSLSHVQLFATPWTGAHQASLSIPNSWVYPNSCPLSQWCHSAISSSVVHFSSCPQSRVLPRECTGHSKHPLPTTQEKTLHMDITRWPTVKSDWLYSLQPKMKKLYTLSKNKTGSWLWLRSWTPYCQIQT